MHSDDPSEPRNIHRLAAALRAYLPLCHTLGPNTSLIIIHPNLTPAKESTLISKPPTSISTYHAKFWSLLRGLRAADTHVWPPPIPHSTNSPKWAFCFNGVPAAMAPAHSHRMSRHAPYFTVAMQPKWVFDHLFGTPERRRAVVQAVRGLMVKYDDVDVSPDLSAYGEVGTSEARQHSVLDENTTGEFGWMVT